MKLSTAMEIQIEMYGEKAFEYLKNIGFDAVDYNMPFYDADKPNPEIYNTNIQEFEKYFLNVKKLSKEADIEIFQTHAPYHVYNADKKLFECRIEEIKYAIRATAVLGAKYTVVHPAQPCFFDPDKNPGFTKELNYSLFEKLIPTAEEYGVLLALENMPGQGVPTSTPEMLIDYIDMMGSDAVVACLDTGHAHLAGENIANFARRLGNRLKVLHLADNCGRMDEHYIPYVGTIGIWDEFMKTLKEVGYDGSLNLEAGTYVRELPEELRDDAVKISLGVLKNLSKLMK